MARNAPTNTDDVIDSRDVIARIEELRTMIADPATECVDADDADDLAALEALADETGRAADWQHGETLIRDSYFEDYARDLADNIGAINKDSTWPNNCVDWKRAARELQMDYTSVDFSGVTYWIRS